MDLFDIAVARKLSGGSGGGGSSDFSTAEVIFYVNDPSASCSLFAEVGDISGYLEYPTPLMAIRSTDGSTVENQSRHNVVLYQGNAYAMSYSRIEATGDASVDTYESYGDTVYLATITGDCTLTFGIK